MKQYLVVGLGRFGSSIAETLYKADESVLALDIDEEIIQEAINNDIVDNAVEIDATDEKSLQDLGINNFDVAFVCVGTNIQASILITLTLKEMGIKRVICKAVTKAHGKVLKKIGADEVVFPEIYMGKRVALAEMETNIIEHMKFSEEFLIIEIKAPASFVNRSLIELDLRKDYNANIIAIRRERGDAVLSPNATTKIFEGDTLIVATDGRTAKKLEELK
ncbi:trk system potassium uptake protein TrkA [Hypnocyclicus thermotrophus]|uniref:Trk system potassium uptake protein TrkA n=1 Tax=Hypnocyclicus thermotrophus TaxID=1627895 RepID=A0AA46I642_9FUSO|nr:TrkA family potassium uptake protein [Hypnocyclicus thermotrophus]TDT71789.1 trk system potassium uptake protein TrkA [Hypnocyclicus thermotrophus]